MAVLLNFFLIRSIAVIPPLFSIAIFLFNATIFISHALLSAVIDFPFSDMLFSKYKRRILQRAQPYCEAFRDIENSGIHIAFCTVPGGYRPLHWHEEPISYIMEKTDLPIRSSSTAPSKSSTGPRPRRCGEGNDRNQEYKRGCPKTMNF